jgi:hypothetical protein
MAALADFYRGRVADTEGRRLNDILAWPDDDLESVHDFIQWLFPLPEPSRFNAGAPLLTNEDISAFKTDPVLQANLTKSVERILTFLGLALSEQGEVVEGANFAVRVPDVWASPNHNWLRITRILRCMTLLGMVSHAQALFRWLNGAYSSRRFPIPADTFQYWTKAVGM